MILKDYRAIYIQCDGSMARDTGSSGGVGFVIKFPEELGIADVSESHGIYKDSNIERLELQALIIGMQGFLDWIKKNPVDISWISKIVLITDRFDLQEEGRTSPYKIARWKKDKGKNFEGKEIKNWDLLITLDKTRKRLIDYVKKPVRIEFRPRKQNKEADKLSKKGRQSGLPTREIAIEGHKIGRRLYDGGEVSYKLIKPGEYFTIHVFRKRPMIEQWEVNAEICTKDRKGGKLKIITDHLLQKKLPRGNFFIVKVKKVGRHHIEIYRTFKKEKKENITQKI